MRIKAFLISVAVLLTISSGSLHGQERNARQSQRQQDRVAQERQRERESREELRVRIQPHVDRIGRYLARMEHRDQLVGAYLNSLGQSMVPDEVDAAVSFSFRVINEFRPNAMALPDGRIYVTSGLLSFVENEAQLATVLGHEIAHVTEEHTLDDIRRRQTVERRNSIIATSAGAALGGIFGGRKGGAGAAATGGATGAAAGFGIARVVNALTRMRFSREQEKEADLIGSELAMARGFDPGEGQAFFQKLHDRFGKRPFSLSRALAATLSTHPPHIVRASNINALLAGDLSAPYQSMRARGELATGSGRFGRTLSGVIRDAGILLAEQSDRFDLARENLERALRYRPNDPRALWALGRVSLLLGRTEEELQRGEELLAKAIEADQRKLYPAIHRDLAYHRAASEDDYAAASDGLKQYVLGHTATHRTLPPDLEEVYDQLVLFGDGAWTVPVAKREKEIEDSPVSITYAPTVWATPGSGLQGNRGGSPDDDAELEGLAALQTSVGTDGAGGEVTQ